MVSEALTNKLISLAEAGKIPTPLIRVAIRYLLKARNKEIGGDVIALRNTQKQAFIEAISAGPIAKVTKKANQQHYEVPTEFFKTVLGPALKYSSCIWPEGVLTLGDAEQEMLRLSTNRAELKDGQRVLELGCGWGSLSLFIAKNYPNTEITAVSNSSTQREYIEAECGRLGIRNLQVLTADMNDFSPPPGKTFDRIVSVEMFEHMHNYGELFKRTGEWLNADGKFFLHIFTHKDTPYFFEEEGADNWMGRHFFSGGMMPSTDLPLYFQDTLKIKKQWLVSGIDYSKTCEAWLVNLDNNRSKILPLLDSENNRAEQIVRFNRWRMFFLACSELFKYHRGDEWFVSHYLFCKR
jgi:cyclopropane-fatty-acyl-phospholipid synthase